MTAINSPAFALSRKNWSSAQAPWSKPTPNSNAKASSKCSMEPAHSSASAAARRLGDRVRAARERIDELIGELRHEGLLDDEIRRMFEAGLLPARATRTER